jgi:hypothetical protein
MAQPSAIISIKGMTPLRPMFRFLLGEEASNFAVHRSVRLALKATPEAAATVQQLVMPGSKGLPVPCCDSTTLLPLVKNCEAALEDRLEAAVAYIQLMLVNKAAEEVSILESLVLLKSLTSGTIVCAFAQLAETPLPFSVANRKAVMQTMMELSKKLKEMVPEGVLQGITDRVTELVGLLDAASS